jgi:hypothetical protein
MRVVREILNLLVLIFPLSPSENNSFLSCNFQIRSLEFLFRLPISVPENYPNSLPFSNILTCQVFLGLALPRSSRTRQTFLFEDRLMVRIINLLNNRGRTRHANFIFYVVRLKSGSSVKVHRGLSYSIH